MRVAQIKYQKWNVRIPSFDLRRRSPSKSKYSQSYRRFGIQGKKIGFHPRVRSSARSLFNMIRHEGWLIIIGAGALDS